MTRQTVLLLMALTMGAAHAQGFDPSYIAHQAVKAHGQFTVLGKACGEYTDAQLLGLKQEQRRLMGAQITDAVFEQQHGLGVREATARWMALSPEQRQKSCAQARQMKALQVRGAVPVAQPPSAGPGPARGVQPRPAAPATGPARPPGV